MKHAHLIPLVGGSAIGTSLALESNPEYIASWSAFAKNDSFCKEYFKNTPFHEIDSAGRIFAKIPQVDIITCVPPCSGLSTATPSSNRGCSAPQNQHMLKVAEFAMMKKTTVILIENAPTLYSPGGSEFAERFIPYCQRYGYSMILYKTSSILHGLPQNRVRSFVILFRGKQLPNPELLWVKERYKPLYDWAPAKGELAKGWNPNDDELLTVLKKHFGFRNNKDFLKHMDVLFKGPVSAWKVFTDCGIRAKLKTEPYKYMQTHFNAGDGIMDRSPYLVWDHSNALMWKSAHKMLNPSTPERQYNVRELMNLMGLPKDFKEVPKKDVNVIFQNVPVNTVKTLVLAIQGSFNSGNWFKWNNQKIARYNNIKEITE